ncbi:MAG TPA: hypothetical protein VH107_05550 [Lacipirellulaceae bacterium]|jgi:hypothetical protein|nr:hypothetical protein [Lacipirellulaceae bacterium]
MRRFLFSAWGVSFGLHLAALIGLGVSMQAWPRGAGDRGSHSMGIVLNHSGDEGELRNGDNGDGEQLRRLEALQAPELLSPPATEPPVTSAAHDAAQSEAAAGVVQASATERASAHAATSGRVRSGSPNGTGEAKVTVFGVEGHGKKFLYLFDRSASMEGAPLSAAKRQLVQSMQSLGNGQQFHIIFFNTKTQSFEGDGGRSRNEFATDRNKQLAANFVGGITADGGTDRMVALEEAVKCQPDVIFFLTDADDPMSVQELAEIGRLNWRAAICVIEFGDEPTPMEGNFLMRLASESGGQYGYVDTETLRR